MEEIVRASAVTAGTRYKTSCTSRSHSIIADEPLDKDGGDLGPAPSELLCMSLAACTSITLTMYAQCKQWDIGAVHVNVTMEKVDDKTVFLKEIRFGKDPGEEAVKRLMQIADKCPVHKTLSNAIEINSHHISRWE